MDGTTYKLQRAREHFEDLKKHFVENPPYIYKFTFEDNGNYHATGTTHVQEIEESAKLACVISADIIHNLRVALEQSFWAVANKYAKSDFEKRKVMFPFFNTEKDMNDKLGKGFFERLDENIIQTIKTLMPYREGGDSYLCSVHDLDVADKHRALIPYASLARVDIDALARKIPMFPQGMSGDFTAVDLGPMFKHFKWDIDLTQFAAFMKSIVLPDKVVLPKTFSKAIPMDLEFIFKGSDFLQNQSIEHLLEGMFTSVTNACTKLALIE